MHGLRHQYAQMRKRSISSAIVRSGLCGIVSVLNKYRRIENVRWKEGIRLTGNLIWSRCPRGRRKAYPTLRGSISACIIGADV